MSEVDQRAVLERLIEERREDYASLSRLLGRNAAYIQQFIKRGVPRELAERDRRTLARYFGIGEQVLGGPPPVLAAADTSLVTLRRLHVSASAGPGAIVDEEEEAAPIAFDAGWLRRLCHAQPSDLSLIRVRGDSMSPTLVDGDEIMVDSSDAAARLRDGIYVLRRDDELIVKRLAVNPSNRLVTVRSDNPAYPTWPDCDPATLTPIGRVVWSGRRLS